MDRNQKHLNYTETINLGSYYTPEIIVDLAYSILQKNIKNIIAIGNPPYNDTTSIIRNSIKDTSIQDKIDADIKTRDLGMSFLLSYDKLKADYVCVLHPLSYLIKKAKHN